MIEDLSGYWTHYRATFMVKEGVREAITISRTFREKDGTQPARVEEELACECHIGDEIGYCYMKLHWYVLPIPGSHARLSWSGRQALSKDEYERWRKVRSDEDRTWRIVCSCGWTCQAASEWAARSGSRLHSQLADSSRQHATRIDPAGPRGAQEWTSTWPQGG